WPNPEAARLGLCLACACKLQTQPYTLISVGGEKPAGKNTRLQQAREDGILQECARGGTEVDERRPGRQRIVAGPARPTGGLAVRCANSSRAAGNCAVHAARCGTRSADLRLAERVR